MTKFIFVTAEWSLALEKESAPPLWQALKQRGLKVIMQKFDPYFMLIPVL
jgi:CTP synthase (UTP-ammonia lyase)